MSVAVPLPVKECSARVRTGTVVRRFINGHKRDTRTKEHCITRLEVFEGHSAQLGKGFNGRSRAEAEAGDYAKIGPVA